MAVELYSFFNFGATLGWVVSSTPRPLYPLERDQAWWARGPVWTGAEDVALTEIRSQGRPARNGSLYRVRYPGTQFMLLLFKIRFPLTTILHQGPEVYCVIKLRFGSTENRKSVPSGAKRLLVSVHTGRGAHPACYSVAAGAPPVWQCGRDVKLTNHFYLMLRQSMWRCSSAAAEIRLDE